MQNHPCAKSHLSNEWQKHKQMKNGWAPKFLQEGLISHLCWRGLLFYTTFKGKKQAANFQVQWPLWYLHPTDLSKKVHSCPTPGFSDDNNQWRVLVWNKYQMGREYIPVSVNSTSAQRGVYVNSSPFLPLSPLHLHLNSGGSETSTLKAAAWVRHRGSKDRNSEPPIPVDALSPVFCSSWTHRKELQQPHSALLASAHYRAVPCAF